MVSFKLQLDVSMITQIRGDKKSPTRVFMKIAGNHGILSVTLENCSPSDWISLPKLPFTFVFSGEFAEYNNSGYFKADSGIVHDVMKMRDYAAAEEVRLKKNGA